MLSKRPGQFLQELEASGSKKYHLGNSLVSDSIHGTVLGCNEVVADQAKAGVCDLVRNVLLQKLHRALIIY